MLLVLASLESTVTEKVKQRVEDSSQHAQISKALKGLDVSASAVVDLVDQIFIPRLVKLTRPGLLSGLAKDSVTAVYFKKADDSTIAWRRYTRWIY